MIKPFYPNSNGNDRDGGFATVLYRIHLVFLFTLSCFLYNKQNQRQLLLLLLVCKYDKKSRNIRHTNNNQKNCEHTKFHVFHYTTTFTFLLYNGINILNWYRIRYLLLGFFCLSLLFFFFFTGKNSSFAPSLFAVFFFFWNLTDFHSKATSLNLRDALHQFRLTCEVNMTFSWDFQKMKNEKRKKCKPNCLRSNAHHMFPEWMQTSTFFIKNTHNVWFIRQI